MVTTTVKDLAKTPNSQNGTVNTAKAETPKENGKDEKKDLPIIVTKPAAPAPEKKILSIAELLKRNEELNKLAKKRSALLEIYDNVTAFAVTESAPGVIVFEDMNRNEFAVKNFLVIGKLVEVAKATLETEMQKLDTEILMLQ